MPAPHNYAYPNEGADSKSGKEAQHAKEDCGGITGFTLIELLAVMAIVAVLAGIVAVAVSGTGSTSRDTQTQEDGNSTGTSVANFFSAEGGAEFFEEQTPSLLSVTGTTSGTETISSSNWPEDFVTDTYSEEFPTDVNNV